MSVGNLNVGLKSDGSLQAVTNNITQAFTKTAKDIDKVLGDSLKGFGDKTANESKKAAKSIDEVGNAAKKTKDEMSSLGKVASSFATLFGVDKMIQTGKSIITIAGNLQQATVAFTTMLGSGEKAKRMLEDLSDFAMKTPFEVTGIRQTAKQLLAYGVTQEEMIPTLKSLGDVAAGVSVPIEQIALAYGQVRTANQLYGTELRQFTSAGVPLIAELSKQFGKTEAEIKKLVEQGKIGFKDVEKAFQSMTGEGGKFFNLMEAQSQTLQGQRSNLKDNTTRLAEAFGTLFIPVLSRLTSMITPMIGSIKERVAENPKLAQVIGYVVAALTLLVGVMSGLGLIIPILTTGAAALGVSLGVLFGWAGAIAGALAAVVVVMGAVNSATESNKRSLSEVRKEIESNTQAQEELRKEFEKGSISAEEYYKKLDELKKKEKELAIESQNASVSIYDINAELDRISNSSLDTRQKIEALEALRAKAVNTAEGLQQAIDKLLKLGAVEKQKAEETMRGQRRLVGEGAIAPTGEYTQALGQLGAKLFESQGIAKGIEKVDKELTKLGGKAKDTSAATASGTATKKIVETNIQLLMEFNRQKYALDVDDLNHSTLTEKQKAEERLRIYSAFLKDQQELEFSHLEEVIKNNKDMSDSEKKLMSERVKTYQTEFDRIDKSIEDSQKKIEDYQKAIQKVADEFKTLKEKAVAEIDEINISLKSLSSDYAQKQAERYADVVAEIEQIRKSGQISADDSVKLGKLEEEKTFLMGVTTEALRTQAVEYSKLNEAQKTSKQYEEDKLALMEKQSIVQAVASQKLKVSETGQVLGIDQKLRMDPVTYDVQYQNEKNMWINITDAKNIEYARDLINQQIKMQNEIALETDKINQEMALQQTYYDAKNLLEAQFSDFVLTQTGIQRKAVQGLISDIDAAIKRIQALQVAKSKSGFMAGGYTGNMPTTAEAGVVHGQEYVISHPMLQQLPGIIPALESVRSGGSFDYSKHINVPNINVQGGSFDLVEAFEKLKFRL